MILQARPLIEVLAEIPDFRKHHGQLHPLVAILAEYRKIKRPFPPTTAPVLRHNFIRIALDDNFRRKDKNQSSQPCCREAPWP
jgi:hypothetical protein